MNDLIADFQRRWGTKALRTLQTVTDMQRIITGYAALDTMLAGGIPRNAVTEIIGSPTSGMTTLAYSLVAQAETAAYVDLKQTFDPSYAVQCGVDSARLLVVQPDDLTHSLEIARDLLSHVGVLVLALDRSPAFVHAQLRRLITQLPHSNCALLVLTPVGGRGVGDLAFMRLLVERVGWIEGEDVTGYRSHVRVLKHKYRPPGQSAEIDIQIGA